MQQFVFPLHLVRSKLQGLYVITTGETAARHVQMAKAAIAGGAAIIQLRAKQLPFRESLQAAYNIRALTRSAKVLFLVNDRVDLALAAAADGVHVGDDDMPVQAARRLLGPHAVIGASASTAKEAQEAARAGANYVGTGAIFATSSKADAGAPIGLEGLRAVTDHSPVPVAAIGGIDQTNIAAVLQQHAAMACVISAVSAGQDVTGMTARTVQLAQAFIPDTRDREPVTPSNATS